MHNDRTRQHVPGKHVPGCSDGNLQKALSLNHVRFAPLPTHPPSRIPWVLLHGCICFSFCGGRTLFVSFVRWDNGQPVWAHYWNMHLPLAARLGSYETRKSCSCGACAAQPLENCLHGNIFIIVNLKPCDGTGTHAFQTAIEWIIIPSQQAIERHGSQKERRNNANSS